MFFYIDVHQELIKLKQLGLKGFSKKYSLVVYARLVAIDLLSDDVNRILYVDSDTLIIKTLKRLRIYT